MKIYQIALGVLIFSAVMTLFNSLGVFSYQMYQPGYNNVNSADAAEVFQLDTEDMDTQEGWLDRISGIGTGILFALGLVWKTLGLATNLGGLFQQYVPGDVGLQFGLLLTILTDVVLAWGGIQILMKITTKQMD